MRYTHYQASFKDFNTGELVTEARPFTEAQLAANNIHHEDVARGITEVSAHRLLTTWNRCCSATSRYFL